MAFGKKKESREVEGYMKLTPKSALIYLAIIVFCIIVISPLVIVFSSSLRSPGIRLPTVPFLRIYSGKLQTGIQQHELSDGTDQQYPDNRRFCALRSNFCYHGSIPDRTY